MRCVLSIEPPCDEACGPFPTGVSRGSDEPDQRTLNASNTTFAERAAASRVPSGRIVIVCLPGPSRAPDVAADVEAVDRHPPPGGRRTLTPRERDVLALMAEGRTNTAVARALVVTEGAVEKHVRDIFGKLGLPASQSDHRRVLAVLTYLRD
jgi:DNA-binding NarL/FixJ family response regulator